MNRDFKGIWTPREIWLRRDLSCQEKYLLSEIHSLFNREKGGCFASNEYLMDFIGVKERRLQEMIASLKDKGLLIQVSFNGRERVLRAVMPEEDFSPCTSEVQDPASQGCGKVHLSGAEKCTPPIYREKSIEQSIESSYKVPKEPAAGAAKPADAGDDGLDKSSKTKRLKADYSPKVQEVAAQFLSILKKNSDVYRAPKDTVAILEVVRQLIETDKQTPEELYKLLDYAAGDREQRGDFKGWSMMIYHKDGIKKFRSKLATIHSSMRSKPKRKFAPSSNDDIAQKNMQEMWDNAL